MDVCLACVAAAEPCRVVACIYKEHSGEKAGNMASESPSTRNVQSLRNLFAEKDTPPMGVLRAGIPHPHLIRRDVKKSSTPSDTSDETQNVAPIRIPRPSMGPKPGGVLERSQSNASNDAYVADGRSPSQPRPEEAASPPPLQSPPRLPPAKGSWNQVTPPKLPPRSTNAENLTNTTKSRSESPLSSRSNSSWESSRQASPPISPQTSFAARHPAFQVRTKAYDECLQDIAKRLLKGSTSNDESDLNVVAEDGDTAGSEKVRSITSPDNYICNGIARKQVWQRRQLPSVKDTGPPPGKPTRPSGMALPGQVPEDIQPPPRAKKLTQALICSKANPPSRAPPPLPASLPPPRTPPLPADEELYGDTEVPERPSSPIPEFTEDEEMRGGSGSDDDELYADAGLSPPALPSSRRPLTQVSTDDGNELYQDGSTREQMYEAMPTPEPKRSASPAYAECKEERATKKERERREKEARKNIRKYGVSGLGEPLDSGLVKASSWGGRLDLPVRKGEKVYILRMEDNPPGKWLVRNDKGEVGYAELANIEVDADSIKVVMISQAQSMGCSNKDTSDVFEEEEEAIYEETI